MITHCVYIDVSRQSVEHRDFRIEESIEGWEWTHRDYAQNGVTGTCDTVFDAIEAVDEWHGEATVTLPPTPSPHSRSLTALSAN